MSPKAVIFDWAGTLIDPGCRAPVRAFQAAFRDHGIQLDEALVRRDMGLGKRAHTERLLSEKTVISQFLDRHARAPNNQDVDALYDAVSAAMSDAATATADPVPGAAKTLADLRERGARIGSTTGYPRAVMGVIVPLAAACRIDPDIVICAEEVADPRPGPGQILACLAAFGLDDPATVVKVDDTVSGLMAGQAAGCVTIAVTGSGNPISAEQVARFADAGCDSVADLLECLDSL
jgi:phosphonoacetaldehyde hydrolase